MGAVIGNSALAPCPWVGLLCVSDASGSSELASGAAWVIDHDVSIRLFNDFEAGMMPFLGISALLQDILNTRVFIQPFTDRIVVSLSYYFLKLLLTEAGEMS